MGSDRHRRQARELRAEIEAAGREDAAVEGLAALTARLTVRPPTA
jgi:hypothetical protein